MGNYFSAIMLPSIIPLLYKQHPDIKIHVIVGDDAFCHRALLNGDAHLSIHFMPQNYSNIEYQIIVDESMYLLCKMDYTALLRHGIRAEVPGVQSELLNIALLKDEPFLLCKSIANYFNMPFSRPCGATENDAQKLHARSFCHISWCALAHEVLYRQKALQ